MGKCVVLIFYEFGPGSSKLEMKEENPFTLLTPLTTFVHFFSQFDAYSAYLLLGNKI